VKKQDELLKLQTEKLQKQNSNIKKVQ